MNEAKQAKNQPKVTMAQTQGVNNEVKFNNSHPVRSRRLLEKQQKQISSQQLVQVNPPKM